MPKIVIPKGKTLFVPAGSYRFVGPAEYEMDLSFKWPSTYTDGTPVQIKDDTKQSNTPAQPSTPVLDSEVSAGKSTGGDKEVLQSDVLVSKPSGKDVETKAVRGKQGQGQDARSGRSKSKDSEDKIPDSSDERKEG